MVIGKGVPQIVVRDDGVIVIRDGLEMLFVSDVEIAWLCQCGQKLEPGRDSAVRLSPQFVPQGICGDLLMDDEHLAGVFGKRRGKNGKIAFVRGSEETLEEFRGGKPCGGKDDVLLRAGGLTAVVQGGTHAVRDGVCTVGIAEIGRVGGRQVEGSCAQKPDSSRNHGQFFRGE